MENVSIPEVHRISWEEAATSPGADDGLSSADPT